MNTQPTTATSRPATTQMTTSPASSHGFYDVLAQLVRQHKRQRSNR